MKLRDWIWCQSFHFQRFMVRKRRYLPFLLNNRGLCGKGVEVGVQKAKFSEQVLNFWCGETLYCVDPWREWGVDYQDIANVSQKAQEANYQEACQRLHRFGARAQFLRMTSEEAAPQFQDQSLDFVYLDAQHHYEAVCQDLALWFPKVKKGGLLAGHDYCDVVNETGKFGVKSAVDEFCKRNGFRVMVAKETWPSWFVWVR